MALDLAALAPVPTKVVANLPYGIAAGVILRTIEELEGVTLWIAMVQREVGERFAAAPGNRAYGIPSVLAQLACDVKVLRQIPAPSSTRCRESTRCSCG
jgi:16S rRNA (adenine1518-N6/adenine1519-N6)-dimethyltransferase